MRSFLQNWVCLMQIGWCKRDTGGPEGSRRSVEDTPEDHHRRGIELTVTITQAGGVVEEEVCITMLLLPMAQGLGHLTVDTTVEEGLGEAMVTMATTALMEAMDHTPHQGDVGAVGAVEEGEGGVVEAEVINKNTQYIKGTFNISFHS